MITLIVAANALVSYLPPGYTQKETELYQMSDTLIQRQVQDFHE